MKYKAILIFLVTGLLSIGCTPNWGSPDDDISDYEPVLMQRSDLENSIKLLPARPIKNYGKIYIQEQLLFVNEKYEGIHVIDNSDPTNPENLAFIAIPGNIDIAMKGNIIYADNAVDLVTLRFLQDRVEVVDRDREVFPEHPSPDGKPLAANYSGDSRPENSVLIRWVKRSK